MGEKKDFIVMLKTKKAVLFGLMIKYTCRE